jgi:Leucine-rich repeat (LRR) protein
MGTRINPTKFIELSKDSFKNGLINKTAAEELDGKLIKKIIEDDTLKYIQISEPLFAQAISSLDKIFEKRPDIRFRIYGLYDCDSFDFSFLHELPHLQHLSIDAVHLGITEELLNIEAVCEIPNLKSLLLEIFDLKDYSFLNHLPQSIEELSVIADTMGGAVNFDCKWLIKYDNLHSLFLGKKAKKNIKAIADITSLKELILRGIKLNSLEFLKPLGLEKLSINYCAMSDLSSAASLTTLKSIELWRILKLYDISFLSHLEALESIKLMDLKYIKELPDLSKVNGLKEIIYDNVPINTEILPDNIKSIIKPLY